MHVQRFKYAFFVLLGHDYNDDGVDDSVKKKIATMTMMYCNDDGRRPATIGLYRGLEPRASAFDP